LSIWNTSIGKLLSIHQTEFYQKSTLFLICEPTNHIFNPKESTLLVTKLPTLVPSSYTLQDKCQVVQRTNILNQHLPVLNCSKFGHSVF
jgi:hypothetical protein